MLQEITGKQNFKTIIVDLFQFNLKFGFLQLWNNFDEKVTNTSSQTIHPASYLVLKKFLQKLCRDIFITFPRKKAEIVFLQFLFFTSKTFLLSAQKKTKFNFLFTFSNISFCCWRMFFLVLHKQSYIKWNSPKMLQSHRSLWWW